MHDDPTATVEGVKPVTRDDVAEMIGVTPGSLDIAIARARERGIEPPAAVNPKGGHVYDEDGWLLWLAQSGRADRIADPAKRRRAVRLAKAADPPAG